MSFPGGSDFIDLDDFPFQLFVILKKPSQHEQPMGWHFGGLMVNVELRILGRDSNDLVILLALIDHSHKADCSRVNDG